MENPEERVRRPHYDEDESGGFNMDALKKTLFTIGAIAVAISVIFTIYWSNQLSTKFVSKSDIDALVGSVDKAQSQLADAINKLPNTVTTQVNTVMAGITNQVSSVQSSVSDIRKEVSGYTSKIDSAVSSVSSLSSKVDKLNDDYGDDIAELQELVKDLEDRIDVLEEGGTSGGSSYEPLSVEVKTIANTLSLTQTTSTSGTTTTTTNKLTGSVRLAITNETNKDVGDAFLAISFDLNPAIPDLAFGDCTATLSGGSVPFTVSGMYPTMLDFYNGAWGFEVPANQTVNLFLTMQVYYKASRDGNTDAYNPKGWETTYYYQVYADVTD